MKKYFSNRMYIAFMAPALILFTGFLMLPALVMFPISFMDHNSISFQGWVGWANYAKVFHDKMFWESQLNVLKLLFYAICINMPICWALSFTLERTDGWVSKVFRFAALFPSVLAITSVGKMWQGIYNTNFGLINTVLRAVGLESWTHSWLSSKDTCMWAVAIASSWAGIGSGVIIKSAAIKGIPHNYVEAALLDGCTPAKADWLIKLPLLRNMVQFDLTTGVVGTFCTYAITEIITSGMSTKFTTTPMMHITSTSMSKLKFGLGCAMAVVFFIECVGVSFIVKKITSWETVEY